ncbi:MAG: C25 family cysteine peptidase [Bacteroidales bacterium]|jgi:hypothetical protein|nr:C25 family cysteine peptidase [Bacteroidales bacterium]HPD23280.1 C25 family cysteine peptidase [Bacteroidales bacterium]HRS99004.1 C25 family cysteine peptidase [Bacteroidales bacterium]HRT79925.1 C25 family cysteine peptidase [Bacteroidales bacterium]
MKKFIAFVFSFFLIISVLQSQKVVKLQSITNSTEIGNVTKESFSFSCNIGTIELTDVKTVDGNYVRISIPEFYPDNKTGYPELPVISKIIEIPEGSDITVNVISYTEQVINLNEIGFEFKIFPNQPWLYKNQDPTSVEFVKADAVYKNHEFYQTELIRIVPGSKIRGVQTGNIIISPFSYDIETNSLIIKNNIQAEIKFKNAEISNYEKVKSSKYSPHFENIYRKIWNYTPPTSKDALSKYPIKYVIVANRMFETTLQPFIEWKTKKGFKVIVGYTDEIGTSAANIKSFVQNLYQAGTEDDPAPTYLLLVGDVAQVATNQLSSHVSDMYFGEFDEGGDYIPEMYIGRFSAVNTTQLETIIEKTLMFEQYTFPNPDYLAEVVLVAGDDATYGPTHANGQINYANNYYFNSSQGVTDYTYLYPQSNSQASAIISNISNGVGFVNYTAHCSSSGWAGPSFTTTNIPSLTNENEYFFSIGNCCQSNKFEEQECFGEALIRASKKGAVVHIGGSNNTMWNEDFYWSVGITSNITANPTYEQTTQAAYDHLFHLNGEDEYSSAGQINFIGNMAVYQSTSTEKKYYFEIYHVMGDPSLMPYVGVPPQVYADYINTLIIGMSSLQVTTEPGAYVAISLEGELLDAKLADNSGVVELQFPPMTNLGTADIVITKQFRAPHISTIQIIPNNSQYDAMLQTIINPEAVIHISNATIAPQFKILNLGQINLNSVTVGYQLNNEDPVEINWTGDLAFLESETVTFPEITLPQGNSIITAYVSSPNGQLDEYPDNDTKSKNILVYSGNVQLTEIISPLGSLCNITTASPSVKIKNFDSNPLTSATIHYSCNGVEDSYNWTGNLEQNQTATITFPENEFPQGENTIVFSIISVNGGVNLANNGTNISTDFNVISSGQLVKIDILTDYYPNETSWKLFDANQNIVFSDGPYPSTPRNELYSYELCLNFGCYTFAVYDSYGDGMNGSTWFNPAKGKITITNLSTSDIIWDWTASGNWSSYTYDFCLIPSSLEKSELSNIGIYPNPSSGKVFVTNNKEIQNIQVYSIGGKLLKNISVNSNTAVIDIENLPAGIYIFMVTTENSVTHTKVIKQ